VITLVVNYEWLKLNGVSFLRFLLRLLGTAFSPRLSLLSAPERRLSQDPELLCLGFSPSPGSLV
jgi:hypothetical protein